MPAARDIAADLDAVRARLAAPLHDPPPVAVLALDPELQGSPSVAALAVGLAGALGRLGARGAPPRVIDPVAPDASAALRAAERVLLVIGRDDCPRVPALARLIMAAVPPSRRIGVQLMGALGPGGGAFCRGWGLDHVHPMRLDHPADFDRLVRWLTGRAVGVALGGGGARAAAHFGVLDGLLAAGVPVDALSGASAGSAVAALFATDRGGLTGVRHIRERLDWLGVTGWRAARLPAMAILRPARYATFSSSLIGELHIEDLPLPFACVSTDVGAGALRVHRDGSVWRAVLASSALPGLIPPVRDTDGALLVDGGMVDNIPLAPLRDMGVGSLIAVDINPLRRWVPRARRFTRRLPGGVTAAMAGAVGQTFRGMTRATARAADEADVYLAPPLPACGILSFGQMEDAYRIGWSAVPSAAASPPADIRHPIAGGRPIR